MYSTAIQIAVALMEVCCQTQSSRILVFSGGAPNSGPGKIIESSLEYTIRSRQDILDGKAVFFQRAREFYKSLALRAVENGHVIDLFACSLDQVGITEQRSLVDDTGGILILNDTFTTSPFSESLISVFIRNVQEDFLMCFNSEIYVLTSTNLKVTGCIGPVTSMGINSNSTTSLQTTGIGKTCKWSIGGLDAKTTLCFYFEIYDTESQLIQNEHG